jgi:hypothetical protein
MLTAARSVRERVEGLELARRLTIAAAYGL